MPGNRTTSRLRPWLVFFGFNVPIMNRPPANLARPITCKDKGKNREDSWSSGNRRESAEMGKPTKIEQRDVGLQAKMPSQHDTRRNAHDEPIPTPVPPMSRINTRERSWTTAPASTSTKPGTMTLSWGGLFQRIPLSPIPPIRRLLIAIPTYSIIPCGSLIP